MAFDPTSGLCSLVVRGVTSADDGEYKCTARNEVGEASLTINIQRNDGANKAVAASTQQQQRQVTQVSQSVVTQQTSIVGRESASTAIDFGSRAAPVTPASSLTQQHVSHSSFSQQVMRQEVLQQQPQQVLQQQRVTQSFQSQTSQEQTQPHGAKSQQQVLEQARQEQARQERLLQERIRQERLRQEQQRQEQQRQEQQRQEQLRLEQQRREQQRQEQQRQEQLRLEQQRQEQARQEQIRLVEQQRLQRLRQEEQLRQEKQRQEEEQQRQQQQIERQRQEQMRQEHLRRQRQQQEAMMHERMRQEQQLQQQRDVQKYEASEWTREACEGAVAQSAVHSQVKRRDVEVRRQVKERREIRIEESSTAVQEQISLKRVVPSHYVAEERTQQETVMLRHIVPSIETQAPEPPAAKQMPPHFTHVSQDLTILEGQVARFDCEYEPISDPYLQIEWFHNERPLVQGSRSKTFAGAGRVFLTLAPCVREDTGSYVCVAKNREGSDRVEIRLTVIQESDLALHELEDQAKQAIEQFTVSEDASHFQRETLVEEERHPIPRFVTSLKGTRVKEGETAHFECRVEPSDDASLRILWFHDSRELQVGSRWQHMHDFGFVALNILHCVEEDAGSYTCRVENREGFAEQTVTLEVDSSSALRTEAINPESVMQIHALEDRSLRMQIQKREQATGRSCQRKRGRRPCVVSSSVKRRSSGSCSWKEIGRRSVARSLQDGREKKRLSLKRQCTRASRVTSTRRK